MTQLNLVRLKPFGWCVFPSLLLAQAAHILPLFGFFLAAMIPFPSLLFRLKQGSIDGRWATAITCALLFVFFSESGTDRIVFTAMAVLGLLLAETLHRGVLPDMAVAASAGMVWAGVWLIVLLTSLLSGNSFFKHVEAVLHQSLELTIALYEEMKISADTIATLQQSMGRIAFVLARLMPGFSAMSLLFVAWTQLLLLQPAKHRLEITLPESPRLNRWKAPEKLIWGLIGCGAMLLTPHVTIRLIATNVLLPILVVYFFQGIGIVSYFLEIKQAPRWIRILIFIAVFFQQVAMILVILLGIFDLWMDFRKLASPRDA
ncbi:MAG: DUF2232 domain-containing protein [Thermodesulfobacteriota bacterium]